MGASLKQAALDNADFRGARLSLANLFGATRQGAKFDNALMP